MKATRWWLVWSMLAVALMGGMLGGVVSARAAAPRQEMTPFPTPTPGPDGRIVYIVQPGDTLWRIAAVAGLTVDELRKLNNLAPDQEVQPGQPLLLGIVAPTPTPTPGVTPTAQPPTPTPRPGTGTVCVLLYEDRNGNGFYEEDTEPLLAGGAVSLTNRSGSVSLTATTSAEEPVCLEKVLAGEDYNLSLAVPQGYNPTTALNLPLALQAGDTMYVSFGAQASARVTPEAPIPQQPSSRSPLLGLIGVVLILAGVALWWYARRMMRPLS